VAPDRRRLLLRTGRELFERYGYKDVSIADITRAAGIATGSFYAHFPGKGEFFDAVLDELEREEIREIEDRVARLSSPVGRLKALCRFAALGARNRPILRGFLTGDRRFLHPGRRDHMDRPESLRNHLARRVRELIADGARTGDIRASLFRDPGAAVIALLEALLEHMGDENIDELLHDVQLLLQRGMGRRVRFPPTGRMRDQRRAAALDRDDRSDGAPALGPAR
jgi:AcrR family transcriptional regulator